MSIEIIRRLDKIRYTGEFPGRIDVLLVPFQIAYQEILLDWPELTEKQFKDILAKHNIFVFPTVEDWKRFKDGKDNRKKSQLGRLG